MKIKIVFLGKNWVEAQERINEALAALGDVEVLSVSDSGIRALILYTERVAPAVDNKISDQVQSQSKEGSKTPPRNTTKRKKK